MKAAWTSAAMQPMAAAMPEMADAFAALPTLTYVRFGDWQRILQLPQPDSAMKSSQVIWRYARTMAFSVA